MDYIEQDCTFSFQGREFTAGGAVVTPDWIIGYPDSDIAGNLRDWHGRVLGTCRTVASWRVDSWNGSHMRQIEATVDGVTYTGRGFGKCMLYRGRRKAVRS